MSEYFKIVGVLAALIIVTITFTWLHDKLFHAWEKRIDCEVEGEEPSK